MADTISMQDVRLVAGEGKLTSHDTLAAVNAILRSRAGCLAAKPADEGVLTALVDARPYLASAFKRSQHAYNKAALEQVDDAIRALSSTGERKP